MMEAIVDTQNREIVGSGGHSISQIYLFLGRCFSYPKNEFYEAMKDIRVREEVLDLLEGLPFKVNFGDGLTGGIPSTSLSLEEFESEYVNTFDINPSRPFYESAYSREDMGARDIYEDLLRFYDYFDIKLSEKEKDYPDHLTVELEFMAFLSKKECDATGSGVSPDPYRLAQLDFLERHLSQWVNELDEKIQKKARDPFYKGVSSFMRELIEGHHLYLKTVLNRLN